MGAGGSQQSFDPARFWAVIEKHGKVIRLDLLVDLTIALNLRLVVERIPE